MIADPPPVWTPRGMLGTMLAVVVASGAVLPTDGTAQDTASAWIGIRFSLEAGAAPGPGQGPYALVVRDVYGNSPADHVGIRPGDRFVAVNGNPLSTYEAWLRTTSNLGPGQTLSVRLFRDSDVQEVIVVADRRPRSVLPDRLFQLEWEAARARFDSLFDVFLEGGPGMAQWPGYQLPHFGLPRGWGLNSATLEIAVNDTGPEAGGSVVAAWRDVQPGSTRQRGPGVDEAQTSNSRRTQPRSGIEPGRTGMPAEQRRRAEREPGPWTDAGIGNRPGPTASPRGADGGGTEPAVVDGTVAAAASVLTPQLLGTTVTVVLGGAVVRDLTAELGRYFGVDTGVLVTDVIDAVTPAALAGFRPGDIIVSVEGKEVRDLPEFRRVLAEEQTPIEITVVRRRKALKLAYPSL